MSSATRTFAPAGCTTRFIETTPELFRFKARQDRATRLLGYLGEIIVNGNPEMAGRQAPTQIREPKIPPHESTAPPPGTRQLLDELGPEGFAQWTLQTEAPAAHRHHLSRRSPIPDGDAHAHLGHGSHRRLHGASSGRVVQPGDVGRGDVRRGDAIPAGRSLDAAAASCASSCPTSASRCSCAPPTPSATRPIPTTPCGASSKWPRPRASTSSAFSIRSTGCRT